MSKKAIIIGAGPAGLTAAYELLKSTDIKPVILEKSGDIGGISKTINYKGNRMDIGGHRFFSKSDRVMKWWLNIMPIQKTDETYTTITYQRKQRTIVQEETHLHANPDDKLVMLVRKRLSRIYFLRKFFTYPIQLSFDTLRKLGLFRTLNILLSYLYAQLIPRKPEKSLEDFLINRFGRQLYLLFFKDYTEKVWGVPCNEISAEWGAQRIKGVSISKAIQHAAQTMFKKNKKGSNDISQKDTETSLIEQFLYPALGPGQLWEEVARQIEVLGGTILKHQNVKSIELEGDKVKSVIAVNSQTGEETELQGDYFFSTMPVQELIAGMKGSVPTDVKEVAAGLQYRDFITVGILLEKLSTAENQTLDLKDTWIYIQERDVKVGRLQLFNNWSPYMVNKPGTVWIGMEYFCNEGDDFWSLTDEEIKRIAVAELEKMGLAQVQDVLDSTVHRVEKTYPAYFGTYNQFDKVGSFVDQIENLFLVGRNGMHKYNNADHSMLTAMTAVDNIRAGITSKENIWAINTEQEYHEEKNSVEKELGRLDQTFESERRCRSTNTYSFVHFLFKVPFNRNFILLTMLLAAIQLTIFKYFYPYPNFINDDSYVYIWGAIDNLSINTYPIGYSQFLRVIHFVSSSDRLVIGIQYFFLYFSMAGFVMTLFYFYQPRKLVQILMGVFVFANPVFLYLANYISSDALFISLSLAWFTLLIWILYRPNMMLLIIQGFILFAAFTVRYNALFYPIIAIAAIFMTKASISKKLVGAVASVALIVCFIGFTNQQYNKQIGVRQFSPFTGWQLANNAIYAYREVPKEKRKPVPAKFMEVDTQVRNYMDTIKKDKVLYFELFSLTTMYMWDQRSPLQVYTANKWPADTVDKSKRWAKAGPLLEAYGKFLIASYPLEYLKGYVAPNLYKFYTPPVEFLETYNDGSDSVKSVGQYWFRFKHSKIFHRATSKIKMLNFIPMLNGTLNAIFLFGLLSFFLLRFHRKDDVLIKGLLLVFCFWLFNFGFSVMASPIALRFQLFPFLVILCFAIILAERTIGFAVQMILASEAENKIHSKLQGYTAKM